MFVVVSGGQKVTLVRSLNICVKICVACVMLPRLLVVHGSTFPRDSVSGQISVYTSLVVQVSRAMKILLHLELVRFSL